MSADRVISIQMDMITHKPLRKHTHAKCKNRNFHWKNVDILGKKGDIFNIFAVLTNTHNLSFGAKIRKNRYTPVIFQFSYINIGYKGVNITRKCYPDAYRHNERSRIVRKPEFCLCENKGADQLRSNCEADQRLCFRYTDSTISLLLN